MLNPKAFGWLINWQPCARLMACLSTFFPVITGLSYPDKSNTFTGWNYQKQNPAYLETEHSELTLSQKPLSDKNLFKLGYKHGSVLTSLACCGRCATRAMENGTVGEAVVRTDLQVWILSRKILASGCGAGGFSLSADGVRSCGRISRGSALWRVSLGSVEPLPKAAKKENGSTDFMKSRQNSSEGVNLSRNCLAVLWKIELSLLNCV